MPHYKLMFPSKYVGAHDLKGDTTVEILSIKMDTLVLERGDKEDKPIVRFKGTKKALVLNKTNAKTIAKLYGNDTDNWIGKKVILFATTCQAFGADVECIRIRPHEPSNAPQRSVKESLDYDPTMGEVAPEDEPPMKE